MTALMPSPRPSGLGSSAEIGAKELRVSVFDVPSVAPASRMSYSAEPRGDVVLIEVADSAEADRPGRTAHSTIATFSVSGGLIGGVEFGDCQEPSCPGDWSRAFAVRGCGSLRRRVRPLALHVKGRTLRVHGPCRLRGPTALSGQLRQ
jgi:hypothetical protein